MTQANQDVLKGALMRFIRVGGATLISILIPAIIEVLGSLTLEPQIKSLITILAIPALTALDKTLRAKRVY